MLWIIFCIDKPGMEAVRSEHLAAHRQYLASMADRLFFSGPHETDDGGTQIGSLFIIKADSREEAQRFIEGENFYRAGVFDSVTIRRTRPGRLNPALAEYAAAGNALDVYSKRVTT